MLSAWQCQYEKWQAAAARRRETKSAWRNRGMWRKPAGESYQTAGGGMKTQSASAYNRKRHNSEKWQNGKAKIMAKIGMKISVG